MAVALVMFWPLLKTAWDVASVNFVVYTDRKRHEARTCYEHRSGWGALGVLCMFVVDMLSLWLSASILMSWVVGRNKYSFPMPSIPVRPAALFLVRAMAGCAFGILPGNPQSIPFTEKTGRSAKTFSG